MFRYYEQLLAYKILLGCGDEHIVEKVNEMIGDYHEDLKKGRFDNWEFRVQEFDDERPDRFLKAILTHNVPNHYRQLEVYSDFDFNNPLFKNTLMNHGYEAVRFFEQKGPRFPIRPDVWSLEIVRSKELEKPIVVTKHGTISKLEETKVSKFVGENESASEN